MIKRTCPQSPIQKHGRIQRRWEAATQPTSRAPASEKWYGFERWNKTHWALSFLRWLSFLPPGVKGNHETILRLRKFGKPAFRTQDKEFPVDVSCGVPGIYFCSLKLYSVQRKQAALNGYVTDKKTASPLCCAASGDTSATLWNSQTPLTACALEALHPQEIFQPWSFPLKPRVEVNWLSLSSGKYGGLWGEASNYFVPCQKPNTSVQLSIQVFLILKTVFFLVFTADKNGSGWHMGQEGPMGYILPRASMVARRAFLPNAWATYSFF